MKSPRPAAGALLAAAAVGCDGPPPAPNPPPVAEETTAAEPTALPAAAPALEPFTDPAGRRWLTAAIPYDAFATADAAPVPAAPTARPAAADLLANVGRGTVAPAATPDRPAGTSAAPAPGAAAEPADGWGAVISAEDLRDEIARARNALAAGVGTVAAFNRGTNELPREAAVLAAAAQIAGEHPGRIPWKEHAPAVRTLAVRVGEAAGTPGRPARDAARLSFDSLDSILGGNPPPDGAVADFDRVVQADRGALMGRMEAALEHLQQNAPDAAALARGGDELAREASVLAALAEFGAHPDYDGAANADYGGWTDDLVAAARAAARFARDEPDLGEYNAAVGRAAATCAACHAEYRL